MTYLKMQQSGPARTPFAQNRNHTDEEMVAPWFLSAHTALLCFWLSSLDSKQLFLSDLWQSLSWLRILSKLFNLEYW